MKEYCVHFSFYAEQYGYFDEAVIKVDAETQFEARRLAWDSSATNDDLKFASNIRVCGIVWNASRLDLQDYFNVEAAHEKYRLKYIENVEIPNAQIKNNETLEYYERQKAEIYGSLCTISRIAEDFGRSFGMLPPTVYEELHYAREFLTSLDGYDFDRYNALLKKIEMAEKWDTVSIYDIRDLFKNGYFSTKDFRYDFSGQFGKNGLYPDCANLSDRDSIYINRWRNAPVYKSMASIPFFDEKDTITGSHEMQYDWQTLVLKKDVLQPERQLPINSIWIANQGSAANFDLNGDRPLISENPFTGMLSEWKRSDFLGVLRPEKIDKIDFEAIKAEYVQRS